ncbi:putative leucine-rich repeat-containing protein DDB_G0290503 [Parasteatoda tepidariorum]|uniref:putative leucine-rich repeat-containing protein DDB_G0290503 n=1 Tax=Parasteatoda tepidariorum TaxID=114398 RepID=UPI0039BC3E3F
MSAEENINGSRRSSRIRKTSKDINCFYQLDNDVSEKITEKGIKINKTRRGSRKSKVPVFSDSVDNQINHISKDDPGPKLFPIFTTANVTVNEKVDSKHKFCKIDDDFDPKSKNTKNNSKTSSEKANSKRKFCKIDEDFDPKSKNLKNKANVTNGKQKRFKTRKSYPSSETLHNFEEIIVNKEDDAIISIQKAFNVDKSPEKICKLFPIFSVNTKLENGNVLHNLPFECSNKGSFDIENSMTSDFCNKNISIVDNESEFLATALIKNENNGSSIEENIKNNASGENINIVEQDKTLEAYANLKTNVGDVIETQEIVNNKMHGINISISKQVIENLSCDKSLKLNDQNKIKLCVDNQTNVIKKEKTVNENLMKNNDIINEDGKFDTKDDEDMKKLNDGSNISVSAENRIASQTIFKNDEDCNNDDVMNKEILLTDNSISIGDKVKSNRKKKKNKGNILNLKNNLFSGTSEDMIESINDFRRVTRSSTGSIKVKGNNEQNDTAVDEASKISIDIKEPSSLKQKGKHKSKSLFQIRKDHIKLKADQNTRLNQEKTKNTMKLFPLFTKSHCTVDNKHSINETNSKKLVQSDLTNNKVSEKPTTKRLKVSKKLKVLNDTTNEIEVIENNSSSDSIKDVTHEANEPIPCKKVDVRKSSLKTGAEKSCGEIKRIVNYPPSKFTDALLSFPLHSHSNFSATSQIIVDNIRPEFSEEYQQPKWDKIVGLTNVKSFQTVNSPEICKTTSGTKNNTNKECGIENNCLLWTEASNNSLFKESINKSCIEDLREWLDGWKYKFANSKRKPEKDEHFEYSSDSCDSDDGFSNSIIISGVPSSGKTSLVFSLANELGFKVLEVNASSSRNGRNITHQLKEALESYHVENIKVDVADEESTKTKDQNDFFAKQLKKVKHLENSEKTSTKEIKIQKKDISGFFQPGQNSAKKSQDPKQPKHSQVDKEKTIADSSHCKISSQTIILFDDIDVVFEEDEGLWSTIKGFLKISKKPVIFTVSRNLSVVKANLSSDIKVIHLLPMLNDTTVKSLKNHCIQHGRIPDSIDLPLLATLNANDARRSLLYSQFWTLPSSNKCDLEDMSESYSSSNDQSCAYDFLQSSVSFSSHILQDYVLQEPYNNCLNLISNQHSLGYDLLYSNLFSLFNIKNEMEIKQEWKTVTESQKMLETKEKSVLNLWQEACAVLEFKKKVLKAGTDSNSLFEMSSLLDSFSFCDSLKGHFCKSMEFLSLPERIDKWSSGLPMCNECDFFPFNHTVLELISTIQVLSLRESKKELFCDDLVRNGKRRLFLEHPFLNIDTLVQCKLKTFLEDMAFILPAAQFLNKNILNIDYFSTLKIICHSELLRQTQSNKRSKRFLHYFDSISLYFDISKIEIL